MFRAWDEKGKIVGFVVHLNKTEYAYQNEAAANKCNALIVEKMDMRYLSVLNWLDIQKAGVAVDVVVNEA